MWERWSAIRNLPKAARSVEKFQGFLEAAVGYRTRMDAGRSLNDDIYVSRKVDGQSAYVLSSLGVAIGTAIVSRFEKKRGFSGSTAEVAYWADAEAGYNLEEIEIITRGLRQATKDKYEVELIRIKPDIVTPAHEDVFTRQGFSSVPLTHSREVGNLNETVWQQTL